MSRTQYLIKNAKINIVFFLANALVAFFSRKFFIDHFGSDFLGLNATISNILGFLLLTELGIGTAITYLLYQPLASKNFENINRIIALLNHYYKRIGLTILIIGLVGSSLLPFIFKKSELSLAVIYTSFYSYLSISVIEYLFNFKQLLIYADQKAFLLKKILAISNISKILLQITSVFIFDANLFIFLAIEVGFAIVKSIVLNFLITRTYPWLKITGTNDNDFFKQEILKKTKQIFSHQIGGFVLTQTDQLLIYTFTSLKMVTFYNNYVIVTQYAVTLLMQPFLSLNSGVGNLVASAKKEKLQAVFNELLLLKYWLAGVIIFILYQAINPFIILWLGKEYLLSENIIIVLLFNFFINIVRKPIDVFLQAFGIFHDTWAPWTEALLNLILSLILGYYYGIFGILLGTSISLIAIICIWKPYLLFNEGFKHPALSYFKKVLTYVALFLTTAFTTSFLFKYLAKNIIINSEYLFFIIYFSLISILFTSLYSLLLLLFVKDSKPLLKRLPLVWK